MSSLPPEVLDLRQRAHHGGRIDQHRAFRRIGDRSRVSGSAILLAAALTAATLLMLPLFAAAWLGFLEFVAPVVGFDNAVAVQRRTVLPFIRVSVPYISALAPLPGTPLLLITAIVTVVLFVISWLIPRKFLPFIYLLRLLLIIQAISIVYFAFMGTRFPYTLARYTLDMNTIGLAIISLVPAIFGLTYFVFDFGVGRKLWVVFLAMGHLLVFIPLQFLLHATLVQGATLLFLPVLFMMFGLLLDVSVLVAIYGWAMSWRDRNERMSQPARELRAS